MKTIRALRQEREWSQFELAVRIGVHPQAIYLWESGRRVPQVPQLRKLGQLFGLCSDDIDLIDPPATVKRAPAVTVRELTCPRTAELRRHDAAQRSDLIRSGISAGGPLGEFRFLRLELPADTATPDATPRS